MAGSCEISNIFSNYISAMYQPEEVQLPLDLLTHLGEENSLGLSVASSQLPVETAGGGLWGLPSVLADLGGRGREGRDLSWSEREAVTL